MTYRIIFFIIVCWLDFNNLVAQNRRIDSLSYLIKTTSDSLEKLESLNQLSWEYLLISDYDASIYHAEQSIKLNSKFESQLSKSYHQIANSLSAKGNYDESLKYHFKSLGINEKLRDDVGILSSYIGIGSVYMGIGNYKMAEDIYNKALVLSKKTRNKKCTAVSLTSLGNIYYTSANYPSAKEFYLTALKLEIENKNNGNIALLYSNLGNVYFDEDSQIAKEYYQKSINIREEIKDYRGLADSYYNLALIYTLLKEYNQSLVFLTKTKELSLKIGSRESLMNSYLGFSDLYTEKKNVTKAFEYYKLYTNLKDSILNIESSKNINKLSALFENEKKTKTIQLLNKEKEKQFLVNQADKQKNSIVILSIGLVLLIVLIFSFWLFKKYKLTSKQKLIIEHQKIEVEKQKKLVDDKQKENTDSINYAKRIQNSFIASNEQFEKNVKEHFIFFKPKDIVSGDFYWTNTIDEKFYLCVADSTGHGIPGAFMSLLNISFLNEALLSRNLTQTDDILNFVRKILILGLKSDELGQGGNDGMDCTLIKLDAITKEIQISGANNPVWIIRNKELIEINVDRMPVGRSPKENLPFTASNFKLIENDTIILFTDGYADQFGGEKGKKFMSKNLKELLQKNYKLTMSEQKEILDETFTKWLDDLEQVDDVTLIGIKI